MKRLLLLLVLCASPTAGLCQLSTRSAWFAADNNERDSTFRFAEEYEAFLTTAKTELFTVKEITSFAEKSGFKPLAENSTWKPGAKYYDINRDRAICLIVAGKNKLEDGLRIIGGHIDSPRIELKARPLYEQDGLALFQTIYHGGIKKYQWVNVPLALMGRIDQTDGTTLWLEVGDDPGEPIFLIPDLAPHVDRQYRSRTATQVIQGEELDPIVGSIPDQTESVKDSILSYLKNHYKISEADFVSAELALVPAMSPADLGFDRGLIAAYGQDDRLCSYVAVRASAAVPSPPYTTISFLVDNEESGSNNNTGANSDYLRGLIGRLLHLEIGDRATEFELRKVLRTTQALSADVTTGINPQFRGVQEASNAARMGQGVVIKRYGHGNDPNSEFTARFRGVLEKEKIPYQTHTYKVDVGGGGTIGNFLSRENMEVLDCGVPLLSMHSPYSVSSKIDLWSLYRAFGAFYRQ